MARWTIDRVPQDLLFAVIKFRYSTSKITL
jgi:hypothetical protein